MREMRKSGWKFSWDMQNERPSAKARMPDLEFIESYVLNLRFFILQNESTSWPNMAKLYRKYCSSVEHVKKFEEIRKRHDSELNKQLWFKVNDEPINYRELFLGMINSQIAHSNQKHKHPLFKGLKKDSFSFHFAVDGFLRCIDFSHTCLAHVNSLNCQAFAYNKPLNSDASESGAG
jgi:hypothetical protein